MSVTPQTTSDIRPIKPLKPYKLYRNQRLNQLSPSQHLYQTIKQEWKNIDGSIKEKMQQNYNIQYKKFLQDKQKWQEKHGPLMLMHKEKSRQKSQNHIVQITMGDDLFQQKSKRPLKRLRKKQCEDSSNIVDNSQNQQKNEQKKSQKQWISKIDSNQSYQSQKKIQRNTTNTTKNKKNVKEDLGQQLNQEYKDQQLMIVKKQDKGSEHLISKMNKKVDFFKNRLSFKEADKDFKYKNHIKQKLKTLNQCQQINLIVEIPKVFGGKGCLQGALYLKNVKQRQNIINSQMITCNNQQSNPKDRKSFYQCLEKELRLKKSEVISESAIKQCFKQSSLDQNDSIDQQQVYVKKTQKPTQKIRQAKILNKSLKGRTSTISQISNCSKASFDSIKNEHKQQQSMNIINITELSNRSYASQQKNIQDPTIIRQQIKQEAIEKNQNRNNTVKKHKKLLRNHLKGFIEEQAQNSGQEDNSKDGSSSQDDNTNISSLIDNDVYISEKDQILVHNKFVNDMIEKQEKEYQNMRKNLQKKYLQQQQNLRKRMKEAAKKNKQKEQQEDKTHLNVSQEEQLIEQCDTQNQSCTANNNNKLKQLQIQLGIKPKCNQKVQQKPLCLMPNIEEFEKAMINKKKGDIKKPVRGGMKNVIQLKGVKSNVKIRMKR